MARRGNKGTRVSEAGGINMTPMIDIVFQMIIFFVLTVEMERDSMDPELLMADSPHGPAEEQKDPRTVTIDVSARGHIEINRTRMSEGQLFNIMRNAVAASGQSTPVVIRGDLRARHEDMRRVMDVCTRAGLYKVRFAAIKEKN